MLSLPDARIDVIDDWKGFIRGDYRRPTAIDEIVAHLKRNKIAYQIIGSVLIIYLSCGFDYAHAADIDTKARAIYDDKLVKFGKWAIIIKGGWDTIMKTLKEDFDGAKRSFLGYMMVFCLLLGFPWACDQVEGLFRG